MPTMGSSMEGEIYDLCRSAIDRGLSVVDMRIALRYAWTQVLDEKRKGDTEQWNGEMK